MKVAAQGHVQALGQHDRRTRRHHHAAGEAAQAHRGQHALADRQPAGLGSHRHDVPGHLAARHEGERGLDLVLAGHEEAVDEVHAGRLDGHRHLARAGLGVGPLLHPQDGGWAQLVADGRARTGRDATVAAWNASGPRHLPIRLAPSALPTRDELAQLPALEAAADTMFEALGIGPLPGPATAEEYGGALVVLVAGDPPVGLCRIDGVGAGAHLEQLAVHPHHTPHGVRPGPAARRVCLGGRQGL